MHLVHIVPELVSADAPRIIINKCNGFTFSTTITLGQTKQNNSVSGNPPKKNPLLKIETQILFISTVKSQVTTPPRVTTPY